MADVLVVVYARSKTAERAARWIANDLEADLDFIPDADPRERGPLAWIRRALAGGRTLRSKGIPRKATARNVNDYAVVVVGSPIWDASLSTAVRRYLANETLLAPELAFFCTSRDDGGHRALERMAHCARRRPVAGLALAHEDIVSEIKRPELARFVQAIRTRVQISARSSTESCAS